VAVTLARPDSTARCDDGPAAPELMFNDAAYLATVVGPGLAAWRYEHLEGRVPVGSWVCVRRDTTLECGFHAPFAGPDVIGDPPADAVLAFLSGGVERARSEGVTDILVRSRPLSYGPAEHVVQYGMVNLGFSLEVCDLSYSIELGGLGTMSSYEQALASGQRTKLRQVLSLASEFSHSAGDDEPEWRLGYEILAENRRVKDRRMSIGFDYLMKLKDVFPDRIDMMVLRVDGSPCAAALVYRVLPDVVLLVSWGDAHHNLRRSPMNLLAAHLTVWCAQSGARLLDLGRASEDGPANLGLMQFKRSVLGVPEIRPNYRWRAP
jgi:hypothetical protein